MENEVFKTDQTSEIGLDVKPPIGKTAENSAGVVLSKSINDAFVSIPAEQLTKYQNNFPVLEKIPNIIKLNSNEIRINKGFKKRKTPKISTRHNSDLSERLAKISKQTKSINLDLDLN